MTKEQAAEDLANKITALKDIDCPRGVINPGLYFGFLRGVEWLTKDLLKDAEGFDEKACEEYLNRAGFGKSQVFAFEIARWQFEQDQLKLQAFKAKAGSHVCDISGIYVRRIQELEAEVRRLRDKYEAKWEGRP